MPIGTSDLEAVVPKVQLGLKLVKHAIHHIFIHGIHGRHRVGVGIDGQVHKCREVVVSINIINETLDMITNTTAWPFINYGRALAHIPIHIFWLLIFAISTILTMAAFMLVVIAFHSGALDLPGDREAAPAETEDEP